MYDGWIRRVPRLKKRKIFKRIKSKESSIDLIDILLWTILSFAHICYGFGQWIYLFRKYLKPKALMCASSEQRVGIGFGKFDQFYSLIPLEYIRISIQWILQFLLLFFVQSCGEWVCFVINSCATYEKNSILCMFIAHCNVMIVIVYCIFFIQWK